MARTRQVLAALLVASLASASFAQAGRLRIVTDRGVEPEPIKIYFGGRLPFYAEVVPGEETGIPFRPEDALPGVEWWAYRTRELRGEARPGADGQPGMEIGHRLPARSAWGRAGVPFLLPGDLRTTWSSGRYLVRARHPRHGEATLRVTVAALFLVGHDAERTAADYRASFRVALADPDLEGPSIPLEVTIVHRDGRMVDRLRGATLVRAGDGHLSPRRVRLSSRDEGPGSAGRPPVENGEAWPTLRVVPESSMRVAVGDRVFAFPLPLRPGPLVHRSDSPPFGHEGRRLVEGESPIRRRRRGENGAADRNPVAGALRPPRTRPDLDVACEGVEIVSDAGRGPRFRVWMGESAVFVARRKATGIEDLFAPDRWLRDVWWTLTRIRLPGGDPPDAIAPGRRESVVARVSPTGLWGDPPTLLRIPADVRGRWDPGRYLLEADRGGGVRARARIDVAAFELVDVDASLDGERYEAALRLQLVDPYESRTRVPVAVRVVDAAGDIRDFVRDVTIDRDPSSRDRFRSGTIRISSAVPFPCRTRYGAAEPGRRQEPGTPCILRAEPDTRLRIVLDDAVFSYPLPLTVFERLVGRSSSPDRPRGR